MTQFLFPQLFYIFESFFFIFYIRQYAET